MPKSTAAGATKIIALGKKKAAKCINKPKYIREFKPNAKIVYPTLDEYKNLLLKMTPFEFSDHVKNLSVNAANTAVSTNLINAFEAVKPTQLARLAIANQELKDTAAAAEVEAKSMTDEEKLVAAGTHMWHCATEKYGGSGQTVKVWSVVRVE